MRGHGGRVLTKHGIGKTMHQRFGVAMVVAMLVPPACLAGCASRQPGTSVRMSCDDLNDRPLAVSDTISRFQSSLVPDSSIEVGTVSGVVVSAHTGEPLQSATVVLRNPSGRATYVITDANGYFTLSIVPSGAKVLEVQLIGFKRTSIDIDTRTGVKAKIALSFQQMRLMC
jgi:carboxypeptidase family protein